MKSFSEFLNLNEGLRGGGKTGLYPLGYGGIGLYPPATMLTAAADALFYLSQDERFSSWWEGSPFDISHIPGKPQPHGDHAMPGKTISLKPSSMPGILKPPTDHGMPGKTKKPVDSPLPGRPTRNCLIKNPSLLDPHAAGKKAEKSQCHYYMPD